MKKIGITNINDLEDGYVYKKWGHEVIIHNDEDYCGKILRFNRDAKFSMHFHMKKKETFYVLAGVFRLLFINLETAEEQEVQIKAGDIVEIPQGQPHQLICDGVGGDIMEVSTQHFDDDSYRIRKGDSQK